MDAQQFFGTIAGKYHDVRADYPPELVKWVIDQTELDKKLHESGKNCKIVIVDVGAGTGKLGMAFAEELVSRASKNVGANEGINLKMVDTDAEMLSKAKEQAAVLAGKGVEPEIIVADAADMKNIPEHSADIVILGCAAHWLVSQGKTKEVTREWTRVLKEGGKVALFTQAPSMQDPVVAELHERLSKGGKDYRPPAEGQNEISSGGDHSYPPVEEYRKRDTYTLHEGWRIRDDAEELLMMNYDRQSAGELTLRQHKINVGGEEHTIDLGVNAGFFVERDRRTALELAMDYLDTTRRLAERLAAEPELKEKIMRDVMQALPSENDRYNVRWECDVYLGAPRTMSHELERLAYEQPIKVDADQPLQANGRPADRSPG